MFGYVLDDVFVQHRAPAGHPERPARLEAVRDALGAAGIASRGRHVAIRAATDEELVRVHAPGYLEDLLRAVPGNTGWLDPDTYYSPGTWDAARAAAGATAELALEVMRGALRRGLAVVRPPGHHATSGQAMGFCLINNVAVAAAAARAAGAARVAILDWDVHHGNGTQDIFWDDPSVLYLSVHQYPYYPGSGAPSELGGPAAAGATVNVGMPSGAGDADYLAAFDHVLVPALTAFAPDLVLVSAGFDAFEDDPLAGMQVTRGGFAAMARRLRAAAAAVSEDRLVAVLEGGYDLVGLAGGMSEVLEALTAPTPSTPPTSPVGAAGDAGAAALGRLAPLPASGAVRAAIDATRAAHAAIGAAWATRPVEPA